MFCKLGFYVETYLTEEKNCTHLKGKESFTASYKIGFRLVGKFEAGWHCVGVALQAGGRHHCTVGLQFDWVWIQ